MPSSTAVSIVIPCYNEEAVVDACYQRVSAVCRNLTENWEIIFVDDGSRDQTWPILSAISKQEPRVRAYKLSRNFGHQSALTCGLQQASGEYVLILDSDLQDPPELLPQMIEAAKAGYDVVYGQRITRQGESIFKKVSADLFYHFLNFMSDIRIPKNTGDFRLLNQKAVESFNQLPEHNRFVRGMFSWVGLRQKAFPYSRDARHAGKTKYNLRKMLSFAVDGITGFSIRPLKIALILAFTLAFIAMLGTGWTLYSWQLGGTVRGWASVLVAVLMVGACQLFVLGIIGEYLGRLFMEAKRRPAYIIEQAMNQDTINR